MPRTCLPNPSSCPQDARQRPFMDELESRARASKPAAVVRVVPKHVLRARTVDFHPLPLKGEGVEPFRTWPTWKVEGEFEAQK